MSRVPSDKDPTLWLDNSTIPPETGTKDTLHETAFSLPSSSDLGPAEHAVN